MQGLVLEKPQSNWPGSDAWGRAWLADADVFNSLQAEPSIMPWRKDGCRSHHLD
eukprot:COSAG02_NODE_47621_length_340_cov_0.556017_1_plen_53_part_01